MSRPKAPCRNICPFQGRRLSSQGAWPTRRLGNLPSRIGTEQGHHQGRNGRLPSHGWQGAVQATPWLSSRVVKSSNCPPTPCAIRNPRRRTPNRVATVSGMVCCRKSDTFATEVAVCGVPCVSLHGPDPSSCAKQRSIAISLMATPAEVGARRRNAPPAAAVAELYAGPTVGCRAYARPRPAPALRSGADRGLSGARCPARVLPSRWSRRWVIGGAMLRPPPGPVRLCVHPPKDLDLRLLCWLYRFLRHSPARVITDLPCLARLGWPYH